MGVQIPLAFWCLNFTNPIWATWILYYMKVTQQLKYSCLNIGRFLAEFVGKKQLKVLFFFIFFKLHHFKPPSGNFKRGHSNRQEFRWFSKYVVNGLIYSTFLPLQAECFTICLSFTHSDTLMMEELPRKALACPLEAIWRSVSCRRSWELNHQPWDKRQPALIII